MYAVGEFDGLQPLEDLLPGEIAVHLIVERNINEGQSELRMRKHPDRMRQAGKFDFERYRDLLFDLFRSMAGEQCDHWSLDIGDVRKRFNRERLKGVNAGADEERQNQEQEQRLMQGKPHKFSQHRIYTPPIK